MHGRPRTAPTTEEAAGAALKAAELRALQSDLLSNHHSKVYTEEALQISAKLLKINPESYTAWNYRKLAVEYNLSQSDSNTESAKKFLDEELRIVESALMQNFKSYGAWHHRKWVLSKGHSSLDNELRLLDKFQKADARNFHAWNYRRFVVALMNRSEDEELKYTTKMINTNISNYSAWHNRSVLLSNLLRKGVEGYLHREKVLSEEYELVHQALFTDESDQSGWFYHHWLLKQTVKTDSPLVVSSWPADGSDVDCCTSSPFATFHSDLGSFPLVLYFNQAVQGVSSSTISIKSVLNTSTHLIWKPLSTSNSLTAQVWVTHLNVRDLELNTSKSYPLEVSLGHSQGIVSSYGFQYSQPTQFTFTVHASPIEKQPAERQNAEMITWKNENFHIYETQGQEPSSILLFGQLDIKNENEATPSKWQEETIANEIALFRELLSMVDCKIGKLTLARLLTAHDAIVSPSTSRMVHSEEVLELYNDLMKLDPYHCQHYKDEHSLELLRQLTSSKESLLRHCYCYKDSTLTSISNAAFLRLNNLSLSRLGSFENLLWVQMLDLSHNELQSIEGLEAMQLLSCLNLSNNKIRSFTALEPLRLLKLLEVLNISHNEIGAHSIDTRRYLCSSPLSHTEEIDSNHDELVTNYWDAYLIFRGLSLIQLDITGNTITNEKFNSFVVKVVPTLKWLDGGSLY